MTIKGLYDKIKLLNTDKVINDAIDNTAVELADINRERLSKGLNADNESMPFYSKKSVEVFFKTPGPIRLKDTGAFYAGITSVRNGNEIKTESTDVKNELLTETERYFPIFGTKGFYKKKYIDESLRPALNEGISLSTGLKFK